MKKALLLIGMLWACLSASAQDLDSLYQVFENNRGEVAYRAALAIDETLGREPNFEADTDKDEIKLKVLRTMILYFFNNNDFQHVVQYSEVGIAHYQKIGDLFNQAGCTMTLANAYQRLGQLDKAIECYNRCNELMDQIGGEMAEINKRYVINNIAEIHLSMGEWETAEEMYRKCIDMLGTVDPADTASNLDLATYYQNLAEVRIAQNNPEAVGFAEQSLELSRKYMDTPHKIINRLMALSKAYHIVGRNDESAALMDEALSIAKENGETFLETSIYIQKGDFTKAIVMADENHFDELLQEALEGAYQAERERNPKLALEYYEREKSQTGIGILRAEHDDERLRLQREPAAAHPRLSGALCHAGERTRPGHGAGKIEAQQDVCHRFGRRRCALAPHRLYLVPFGASPQETRRGTCPSQRHQRPSALHRVA